MATGGAVGSRPLLYCQYGPRRAVRLVRQRRGRGEPVGKRNEDLQPRWDSYDHHGINLQMNYWIAEPPGGGDRNAAARAIPTSSTPTVAMAWRDGEPADAALDEGIARPCTVLHALEHWQIVDAAGREVAVTRDGHRITFDLRPVESYRLTAVQAAVTQQDGLTRNPTVCYTASLSRCRIRRRLRRSAATPSTYGSPTLPSRAVWTFS